MLVCTHDSTLERTTNVRERFPDRYTDVKVGDRVQRHWFVESFTLAEIKRLDAGSWFGPKFKGAQMLTFQETIDLVKGKAGLFPELKIPERFRAKGFDPEQSWPTRCARTASSARRSRDVRPCTCRCSRTTACAGWPRCCPRCRAAS